MKNLQDILNKNERARNLLKAYHKAAVSKGYSPDSEEYKKGREAVVMLAISMTPQAMQAVTQETYNRLNSK